MTGSVPDTVNVDRRGEEVADERGRSVQGLSIQVNTIRRMAVYGALVLDFDAESASIDTREVALQQSDWAILDRLATAGGAFVRGVDLLADIWGEDMRDDSAFLRAWVRRLNDRLGVCCAGRPIIDTIPGGYRLLSPLECGANLERVADQRTTRAYSNVGSARPETYIPSAMPARR